MLTMLRMPHLTARGTVVAGEVGSLPQNSPHQAWGLQVDLIPLNEFFLLVWGSLARVGLGGGGGRGAWNLEPELFRTK